MKKILISITITFFLFSVAIFSQANYTRAEYDAYMKIAKATTAQAKESNILGFVNKFPKSALMKYVKGEIQKVFSMLLKGKNYQEMIKFGKNLLNTSLDKNIAYNFLCTGYYGSGDFKNYIVYGKKLYKLNPSPTLAYYICLASLKINDEATLEEYAGYVKANGNFQMKMDILSKLNRFYRKKGETQKALNCALEIVNVIEKSGRPANFKGDWNKYLHSFYMPFLRYLAVYYTKNKNYSEAIKYYNKIVKISPKNAFAHFSLGLLYWYSRKATLAAPEFAKAVVINDPKVSPKADAKLKEMLKKIKNGNKKYQELIAQAKTSLGM